MLLYPAVYILMLFSCVFHSNQFVMLCAMVSNSCILPIYQDHCLAAMILKSQIGSLVFFKTVRKKTHLKQKYLALERLALVLAGRNPGICSDTF